MHEALCRLSGTTLDSVHAEDGPPITQRTSGLKGKLITGLGRGSSYNIYDYQGFGFDYHEAQERLEEAEEIMVKAWTGGAFKHHGKFWQLDVPMLRPRPYTKPHPIIVRGSS